MFPEFDLKPLIVGAIATMATLVLFGFVLGRMIR